MRILLVEDEKMLSQLLTRNFKEEGYTIDQAFDGGEALSFLEPGTCSADGYDCIILDIMLPVKDGLSVLKTLRRRGICAPVLLLTAKDSIQDRVAGLDAGADDYLIKPFSYDELSARVRALLRRDSPHKNTILQFENLSMNTVTREVHRVRAQSKILIELAAKEYAMLEYFMHNPRRVLTRGQIVDHVWSFDFAGDSNIVDVYIRYLRRKMDYDFEPRLIHTIRGIGYVLKTETDL